MSQQFDNVWDATEDTAAEAENMKLRSSPMIALQNHIDKSGVRQEGAAKVFGVRQPRVSDRTRGHIDLFSIDSLVNMLTAAGLRVALRVGKAA
jgi:predicted XRE-type DNA-binding protein